MEVDEVSAILDEGDWLVLATDGVTKGLDDGAIAKLFGEESEPTTAATQLAEHGQRRAARAGVVDDITAVVVELVSWQGSAWGC